MYMDPNITEKKSNVRNADASLEYSSHEGDEEEAGSSEENQDTSDCSMEGDENTRNTSDHDIQNIHSNGANVQ